MPELTMSCFKTDDQERMAQFQSLRQSLHYVFPEDPCPEDAVFFMVTKEMDVLARAAVVPNSQMPSGVALLGFFESRDNAEAATLLFQTIGDFCRRAGKKRVIGPVNGSTWQSYRVALPFGRPFFMDVVSQPYYAALFEGNGFETIANYTSSVSSLDRESFSAWEEHNRRFTDLGFSIQNLDMDRMEEQLREIYSLSRQSFLNNFLYTPISEETFLGKYIPLLKRADPEFIFLLRDAGGNLAGYHFAMENFFEREHRELVQKTIAVASKWRGLGLGSFLMENCRRKAWQQGFVRTWHALMHESNVSARINASKQTIARRYKLYSLNLE